MIAIEYRTRLKDKQHVGGDVMAFYFERPLGFEFRAGQYIDITLINPHERAARPGEPHRGSSLWWSRW